MVRLIYAKKPNGPTMSVSKAFIEAGGKPNSLFSPAYLASVPKILATCTPKLSQPVVDAWLADMKAQGIDGQALLDEAKQLIADYK